MDPKQLENVYKRNLLVIKRQIDGLTHEDSLIQPPFRGNCLNFILGHIAASRQIVIKALDAPQLMREEHITRYTQDADPVTGECADIMTLEEIMEVLQQSQETLSERLLKLTRADLSKEIGEGEGKTTLGRRIEFLSWHEAYHTGQTEYLRQLAGTNDKVI